MNSDEKPSGYLVFRCCGELLFKNIYLRPIMALSLCGFAFSGRTAVCARGVLGYGASIFWPLPPQNALCVFGLVIVFETARMLESPSRRHAGCISDPNDGAPSRCQPIWSHSLLLFACFGSWLRFLKCLPVFLGILFSLFSPGLISARSIPRSALLSSFVSPCGRGFVCPRDPLTMPLGAIYLPQPLTCYR